MAAISGKIISVNISEAKGVAKDAVPSCQAIEGHGLAGDAHGGDGHRQVSLLAMESAERMRDRTGVAVEPGDFAENLTTGGLELHTLPIGTRLSAGVDCVLEITQIGKECHAGCAISKQAGVCVMPLEGVFAKVVAGGVLKAGDEIEVL